MAGIFAMENKVKTITRVDPVSVMRIAGICYGALGLLEGLLFGLVISLKMFTSAGANTGSHLAGPLIGLLVVVGFPIIFGAFGALMAGLGAAIYNVAAKYLGGIAVTVE